ncbi:hypothetical protein [Mycolicibacterium mageritense]|uniref:hypothetical protein n=1 Tax=Mycolicibacterium mageritense TaxID=53462 RepID=UPI0023F53365|nr:hypothetical protein [Mycolicibacterium mageritense]
MAGVTMGPHLSHARGQQRLNPAVEMMDVAVVAGSAASADTLFAPAILNRR